MAWEWREPGLNTSEKWSTGLTTGMVEHFRFDDLAKNYLNIYSKT
jgi:hypothetical protein